jgi:hypothetical protein
MRCGHSLLRGAAGLLGATNVGASPLPPAHHTLPSGRDALDPKCPHAPTHASPGGNC